MKYQQLKIPEFSVWNMKSYKELVRNNWDLERNLGIDLNIKLPYKEL